MATQRPTRFHANHPLEGRKDPGKTAQVRTRFEQALRGRFRYVRGALRESIGQNDALGLEASGRPLRFGMQTTHLRPQDFGARTEAERIDAFEEWIGYTLTYRVRDELRPPSRRAGRHYTADHVRQGFIRGIRAAGVELRRAGYEAPQIEPQSVLDDSRYEELLTRLYSDTYHDVQVVADATKKDLVRTLSERLRGETPSPRSVAADLIGRVEAVGETRSELVATARVIDALNTAALERYARAGVPRVTLIGGVSDRDVEDGAYEISAIRRGNAPRPPIHPRDTRFVVPVG